jgi:hypothetical protein
MTVSKIPAILIAALFGQFSSAAVAQSKPDTSWIPYSATYTESFSTASTLGKSSTQEFTDRETRSTAGSTLSLKEQDGKPIAGTLWRSDGQILSLDYVSQRAASKRNVPRTHLRLPSVPPTGTLTIAGVSCHAYPIHLADGRGEICIDLARDILVRQELHLTSSGIHQDSVKQLTAIDFSKVDDAKVAIPDGFTVLAP